MAVPPDVARAALSEYASSTVGSLASQGYAKHVLKEVSESPSNYPNFAANLEDKLTFLAYDLLSLGCSLMESGDSIEGAKSVFQGASLLAQAYDPLATDDEEGGYHLLIAAMAFYCAGHYSRAFIGVRSVEAVTPAGRIVASFLRKDTCRLIENLNVVLLSDLNPEEAAELEEQAIAIGLARAVALAFEFVLEGQRALLDVAMQHLRDARTVAELTSRPGWWWIVRLMQLIVGDIGQSSMWQNLPPYFDPEQYGQLRSYVQLLAFGRIPIVELWESQLTALPLALDRGAPGAVVNMRTSAGKTRVAELCALQTLLGEPTAKVLYLAPFRSLALEIEQTFGASFVRMGFGVSHLYGGARASSADAILAESSSVIIATPEKARAMFRSVPETFRSLRLIIVDEGHLVGADVRQVKNELFLDHLRAVARAQHARILLLSAVLPNAEELSQWVTGDASRVARSVWKPSTERFGVLRWSGTRVRVDWKGDFECFNPAFVEQRPLGFGRRKNLFPNNKNEAIAAAAVRLSQIGPVMIFTGKAVSVPTLASAVLLGLGEAPPDHPWPEAEWKAFAAVAEDDLPEGAIETRAARAGVICHSNRLTQEVRLSIERLMRARPPKIIVATTTLAQGVNIGISSVIVASPYTGASSKIERRDFWNVCGRAGRAFVDGEGKVLYAIDETTEQWQRVREMNLANHYFEGPSADRIQSGLLMVVRILLDIASKAEVPFELLLELCANNDFSRLGDQAEDFRQICDLVDDELLAMQNDAMVNPDSSSGVDWVEQVFRDSLAAIQARSGQLSVSEDQMLRLIGARSKGASAMVQDGSRGAVVASGLPLSTALRAVESIETFRQVADRYLDGGKTMEALVGAVKIAEDWTRSNGQAVAGQAPASEQLSDVRSAWLSGVGLRHVIALNKKANTICRDFYGYQLPWILHAAGQLLSKLELTSRPEALSEISLLVELGVPTSSAAHIYLAGLRSRVVASELSQLQGRWLETVAEVRRQLHTPSFVSHLRSSVSERAQTWLDLFVEDRSSHQVARAPAFETVDSVGLPSEGDLHVRALGQKVYLCSSDGSFRKEVIPSAGLPFDTVANDPRFKFVPSNGGWMMVARDPRIRLGERAT
jgi:hypothetical protein